jgi:hypothetical protein
VSDLLKQLSGTAEDVAALAQDVLTTSEGTAGKLSHPMQRSSVVAVTEACCQSPMEPRLDPRSIDSAGIVIRRVYRDATTQQDSKQLLEAWCDGSDGSKGWRLLSKAEGELDPDPTRRKGLGSGNAYLDSLYARTQITYKEATTPAFVARHDVCSSLNKSVIFGVVPTADSATAVAATPSLASDDTLPTTIPILLKAGSHAAPLAGQKITSRYGSTDWLAQNNIDPNFRSFLALVQATVVQYGIFDNTPTGNALLDAVNQITVVGPDSTVRTLGDLLQLANNVLIGSDNAPFPSDSFNMPVMWTDVTQGQADAIYQAIKGALTAKSAGITPNTGRFDEPNRLYRVRVFIRVKDTPQCPPRIVWTQASGPYTLAAWYEAGKQPPIFIPLPDPTNRDLLKSLGHNVSFGVSGGLQQMLQSSNMQGLMSGSGGGGNGGLGIDWICSFSLPIITICAFFVLNIFLSLLNIVFFWMAFIKICIPIPKKQ